MMGRWNLVCEGVWTCVMEGEEETLVSSVPQVGAISPKFTKTALPLSQQQFPSEMAS